MMLRFDDALARWNTARRPEFARAQKPTRDRAGLLASSALAGRPVRGLAAVAGVVTAFSAAPALAQCASTNTGLTGSCTATAVTGPTSTAVGNGANATGGFAATAYGDHAIANGDAATATGASSTASGLFTTATGTSSTANGFAATATGAGSNATGDNATATGFFADAIGVNATATGQFSNATGTNATAYGQASIANGANVTATGQFSNATGTNATAYGQSSIANGVNATATGQFSNATGTNATAYGQSSIGNGTNATALGQASLANADAAVGNLAVASGNNSSAFGANSVAAGANATAIGFGASAAFAGSTAIGAGAVTTAPNQMVFGTASNTYVAPGITSAASLAAQSGPTSFVTTDAAGHLATANFSPQTITNLQNNVTSLNSSVVVLQQDISRSFEGTAIAIAMGGGALPSDKNFAFTVNWGTFEGQNATAFLGQWRLNPNLVLNAAVGAGFQHNGVGGRAGLTYAW
jgi:hypothetical protein